MFQVVLIKLNLNGYRQLVILAEDSFQDELDVCEESVIGDIGRGNFDLFGEDIKEAKTQLDF